MEKPAALSSLAESRVRQLRRRRRPAPLQFQRRPTAVEGVLHVADVVANLHELCRGAARFGAAPRVEPGLVLELLARVAGPVQLRRREVH